jgi:hypothetical protein
MNHGEGCGERERVGGRNQEPLNVFVFSPLQQHGHKDRYLEQQQTEKIETEVSDVDGIRITKVYAS